MVGIGGGLACDILLRYNDEQIDEGTEPVFLLVIVGLITIMGRILLIGSIFWPLLASRVTPKSKIARPKTLF